MIDDVPDIADPVEIGHGGFATVYRATDLQAGRSVAVKLLSQRLDDVALSSFDRERTALARLSTHPNVVTLHRSGLTSGGVPYLVMEYATGGSLANRLSSRGRLPWSEAVDWMVPVCEAVDHAHRENVLHRDIKPQNILISAHGRPLLSDFGIARMTAGTQTMTGRAKLSLAYASPEQIDGLPLNTATDVYSLGATLYALIEGSPAFTDVGDSGFLSVAKRILADPPPPLDPTVPAEVAELVLAAMAKEAADRPTVGEMHAGLRRAALASVGSSEDLTGPAPHDAYRPILASTDDQPTVGVPGPVEVDVAGPVARAARRSVRPLFLIGLAVAALIVLGGGLVAIFGGSAANPSAETVSADALSPTDEATGETLSSARASTATASATSADATAEPSTSGLSSASSASSTSASTSTTLADVDGDGVVDESDNCPQTGNPGQVDTDGDNRGDRCDDDDDGDGVADDVDNCPSTANDDQLDIDADGSGDACDDFPDVDADGVIDTEDPCVERDDDPDADGDGIPDQCDTTPRGMMAVTASAQVTRVTIENEAFANSEADMFGDLIVNDVKVELPVIADSRDVRPGNWESGPVSVDAGSPLVRIRVWIRDDDRCLFCDDDLVDLSPGPPEALHVVIDTTTGEVDLSNAEWNRLEPIGRLTGPDDGDLSGTITQRGDDDETHLGSIDLALNVQREPVRATAG